MKVSIAIEAEDNKYHVDTYLVKENVENLYEMAHVFYNATVAAGFTQVSGISFYDSKKQDVATSEDIMNMEFRSYAD